MRSSASHAPSPLFLWPCQISGMKLARGQAAPSRQTAAPSRFHHRGLQAFTVHTFGIGQMQVRRAGQDGLEERTKRCVEVRAGELGVGYIQADAHASFLAELLDEVGVDKKVVITLPTEVPGKGAWSGE